MTEGGLEYCYCSSVIGQAAGSLCVTGQVAVSLCVTGQAVVSQCVTGLGLC